jgi:hypothetical protein
VVRGRQMVPHGWMLPSLNPYRQVARRGYDMLASHH